jgi:hypothetical protein
VDELRERGAVVLGVGIGARDAREWDGGGAFIVCMLGAVVAVRRRGPVMAVDFEFEFGGDLFGWIVIISIATAWNWRMTIESAWLLLFEMGSPVSLSTGAIVLYEPLSSKSTIS